jgi:hypothetical protein
MITQSAGASCIYRPIRSRHEGMPLNRVRLMQQQWQTHGPTIPMSGSSGLLSVMSRLMIVPSLPLTIRPGTDRLDMCSATGLCGSEH